MQVPEYPDQCKKRAGEGRVASDYVQDVLYVAGGHDYMDVGGTPPRMEVVEPCRERRPRVPKVGALGDVWMPTWM